VWGGPSATQADTPSRLETVQQACENADGALWPIRRTSRKPRDNSKRGEGAYTTNTVDVIVANPGPDENYHRAIYKAFKAQRGVPNKQLYVADSSAFGPSTFFSKLSDDAVTYLHMSGVRDLLEHDREASCRLTGILRGTEECDSFHDTSAF